MTEQAQPQVEAKPEDIATTAFQYANVKFKDLPQKADPNGGLSFTKSFHVEYNDPDTGNMYTGDFTCRRLTIGLTTQVGVRKMEISQGVQLTPGFDVLVSWIAYLDIALTKTGGDWWDPLNMFDQHVLHAVHDYVRVWEDSFRNRSVVKRL